MSSEELDELQYPTPRDPVDILFLALGHAGGRLIAHLPRRVPELSYAMVDTDRAALEASPFDRTLLLGGELCNGQGSGSNPDLALRCAEAAEEDLLELIDGYRVVMLIAGLGGGTGGGVGPWLAARARERGQLVLAGLTRPLEAEGGHRRHLADTALSLFRDTSDGVFLFPLESCRQPEDTGWLLPRLFVNCGKLVGRSLGGLAVMLRSGWLMPLALMDVVQMLQRCDGNCRLVAISSDEEDRVENLLEQLFEHPLLDQGSLLAHSGGVILGLLCGPGVTLAEVERVSLEMRRVLRSDAEFRIGIAQDERFGRYLGLVVMVAEHWSARVVPLEALSDPGEQEEESQGELKLVQSEIELEGVTQGRFKDAEPTVYEGADLDTPTFIRRGLKLSNRVKGNAR